MQCAWGGSLFQLPVRKLGCLLFGLHLLSRAAIRGPVEVFLSYLLDQLLPGVGKVYFLLLR